VHQYSFEGDSNDSAGSNNGTLLNGPTFTTGKLGQAISLDGSNDGVRVTPTGSLTGNFTVAVWAKPNASTGKIIGTRSPNGQSFDMGIGSGYGGVHSDIGDGTNWINTGADATLSVTNNTWYHIVEVVTNTGYTIYVNGTQAGSGSWASNTPLLYDANHVIAIGNSDENGVENFTGLLDDVRIYNRALSAADVYALYNGGSGVAQAPYQSFFANVLSSLLNFLKK